MTLKELHEQRATLAARIKEIADAFNSNGEDWQDATQEANWTQLNKDYDELQAQIQKKESARSVMERAAAIAEQPGNHSESPNSSVSRRFAEHPRQRENRAFAAWLKDQAGLDCTSDEQQLQAEYGYFGKRQLDLRLYDTLTHRALQDQFRDSHSGRHSQIMNAALTSTTGSSGGYSIPAETFVRAMEVNLLAFGSVMQVAETITTASGEKLVWPTFSDTSNSARQVAESTAVDDNAGGGASGDGGPNPTFGQFVLQDYKYTSDTLLVPYELLQDSPIDLPSILGAALGQRLARKLETDFTTGAGTTLPWGIVVRSSAGVTSAQVNSFTGDDVITLQHSVDPAYRIGAAFMCHDAVIAYVRKFKDGQGQYLWQSGFQAGVPDTILGSPVYVNQAMSSAFTTGEKLMLYGALRQYKVRRIGAIRFYRLQERYRQKDQDGFVAFIRCDGDLLDAGTDPVKHLKTA